ncbi:MAG TPA: fasciclin domain-containing protein [Acidimicrobiales bacterium]|nr:fasciclin domain-containing protein [Acidimicrobiales bacterium]
MTSFSSFSSFSYCLDHVGGGGLGPADRLGPPERWRPRPRRAAHPLAAAPVAGHIPQIPQKEGNPMRRIPMRGLICVLAALTFTAAACGGDDDDAAASDTTKADTSETTMPADDTATTALPEDSSKICDTDQLVQAVENGPAEGTLSGMTDDPVGTAASSNPVLTTLVTAVTKANLVDTLNAAPALTVFAPTDCAFAALDPATLDAALADPTGLLTQVLGFHVIPGEELSAADLATKTSLTTFTGETLPIAVDGDEITVGGQAKVVVPDIHTANATVFLIDTVMLPPQG